LCHEADECRNPLSCFVIPSASEESAFVISLLTLKEVEEFTLPFKRQFYVYILASKSRRIYVGMTNSLLVRVSQHRRGEVAFTNRYRINRLVYYEIFKYVNNCIARETQLKAWSRAKKVALIESMNPTWQDFAEKWGKPIKPLNPEAGPITPGNPAE